MKINCNLRATNDDLKMLVGLIDKHVNSKLTEEEYNILVGLIDYMKINDLKGFINESIVSGSNCTDITNGVLDLMFVH